MLLEESMGAGFWSCSVKSWIQGTDAWCNDPSWRYRFGNQPVGC